MFVVETISESFDIPSADSFLCHESWIVMQSPYSEHQCVFQRLMWFEFTKWTPIMKPILKRTFRKNIKINDEVWHRIGNRYGLLTYRPPYIPSSYEDYENNNLDIPERDVETEDDRRNIENEI